VRKIPHAGSLRLLKSLALNSKLEEVELTGLSIGDFDIATSSLFPMGALTKVLIAFRSLISLKIAHWSLDEKAIEVLCGALGHTKTLERLELYRVRFETPESTGRLFRFLSENLTLDSLCLENIHSDDGSLRALCKAFKQNATLKSLDLSLCRMSDLGVRRIAELLEGNGILENLSFVMTEIRNEGLFYLGNALKKNTSLESLRCLECLGQGANEEGVQSLIDGQAHHRKLQLRIMECTRNDLPTQTQKDEISFFNERNKKLWPLLNADPPLALWPEALQRASQCQAPDMLYFLVKEKCDLFRRSSGSRGKPAAGKRKRPRGRGSSAGRRTRQRTNVE